MRLRTGLPRMWRCWRCGQNTTTDAHHCRRTERDPDDAYEAMRDREMEERWR